MASTPERRPQRLPVAIPMCACENVPDAMDSADDEVGRFSRSSFGRLGRSRANGSRNTVDEVAAGNDRADAQAVRQSVDWRPNAEILAEDRILMGVEFRECRGQP